MLSEMMIDVCGASKTVDGGQTFAHSGMANLVDALCSPGVFEVLCAPVKLKIPRCGEEGGGSVGVRIGRVEERPLFPTSVNPFTHVQGVLALVQALIDLSCTGILDGMSTENFQSIADVDSPLYRGWRVVFTGHSLGASVASILHERALKLLKFPGISSVPPLFAIGLGGPPCLSRNAASVGACTVGELAALHGSQVLWKKRDTGAHGAGVWDRPTPIWWPVTSTWTPHLPLVTSIINAQDIVPTLSITTFKKFALQASHPSVTMNSMPHAMKGVLSGVVSMGGAVGGALFKLLGPRDPLLTSIDATSSPRSPSSEGTVVAVGGASSIPRRTRRSCVTNSSLAGLLLPPSLVTSVTEQSKFESQWRRDHWVDGVGSRITPESRLLLPGAVLTFPREPGRPFFDSQKSYHTILPCDASWTDHKVLEYVKKIIVEASR